MSQRPESDAPISIESLMQKALKEPGMLSLAAGFTDNSILPREEIASLARDLLSSPVAGGEALQYGDPQGRPGLRRRVASRVRRLDEERGGEPGPLGPENVVITTGSQQGLELTVRALCRPGDVVLVEAPTYFVFLDLLRELGIEAVSLPATDDRLDADRLPELFEELEREGRLDRVRAVYVMGYFANPTGYSLPEETKRALTETLEEADLEVPVIEDTAYREFHFGEPWPAASTLCLESAGRPAVYAGTFTKSFATGLKCGYLVVRDSALLGRVRSLKRVADFGTANFVQAIVERALEREVYDRFLERMRPLYAEKARVLHRALLEGGLRELGWRWEEPRGGLFHWLAAPPETGVAPGSEFYRACLDEKVMYVPGSLCYAEEAGDRIRLSYGNLGEAALEEAAQRLARAARKAERAGAVA